MARNSAIATLALLAVLQLLPSLARAQDGVWVEKGDAHGVPEGIAQRALTRGPLETIVGTLGPLDGADAFALRITDPAIFSVEVDASFDLEVTLLAPDGSPRATARRGEHVLVVAGSPPVGTEVYALYLEGAQGAGRLDVVLAIDETLMDRYCLGTETAGDFHCHGVTGDAVATSAVALADLDGDGQLDAVFGSSADDDASRVCPGDGVGRFSFTECFDIGGSGSPRRDVAIGDLDEDGSLDVVFAETSGRQLACLGDGALGFACQPIEVDPRAARGVALGHVDADGNLDAVFAVGFQSSRACFGDGLGGFSFCSDVNGTNEFHRDVVLGHFDADAHLDAAFSTSSSALACLGDGVGGFACSIIPGVTVTSGVAAGLLDADAEIDLVFSDSFDSPPTVCLGDGSGGFTCSEFGVGFPWGLQTDVALADFNNDGELDAVISSKTEKSAICFGDGAGTFDSCAAILHTNRRGEAVAVGALAPASVGWDDFETGDLRAWANSVPDS